MFSPCVPTLISSSYFCILHETNINCAIWFEAFLSFVLWLVWILSEVPFLLSVVSPFHCKLCSFSCLWLGLVVNGLGKVASIYFTWAVNFTQLCTQLNSIIKQIYMFTKLVLLHRHLLHKPTPSLSLSLSLNIFSISGCKICHILNHVSTLSLFQPFSLTYTWNA